MSKASKLFHSMVESIPVEKNLTAYDHHMAKHKEHVDFSRHHFNEYTSYNNMARQNPTALKHYEGIALAHHRMSKLHSALAQEHKDTADDVRRVLIK